MRLSEHMYKNSTDTKLLDLMFEWYDIVNVAEVGQCVFGRWQIFEIGAYFVVLFLYISQIYFFLDLKS